jgi:hypothetical protein
MRLTFCPSYSEKSADGYKTTKLEQILLNGNNICMVSWLRVWNERDLMVTNLRLTLNSWSLVVMARSRHNLSLNNLAKDIVHIIKKPFTFSNGHI